uniref:Zasp-like motif domain-containing protein n=1 Tax=Megaselia scalaris TaxID=36166 RepID=T1GZ62_MEGSC
TPSGNTTPNQSKSFRILQKITSTEDGSDDFINQMNQPAELQKPHYSRQMMATPQQQTNNAAIEQLQRMQQNRESGRQGPPMKYPQPPTYVQQRAPYQNDNEQYIPPSQQQAPEPKIYTGSAIPSRSFKLLQAM